MSSQSVSEGTFSRRSVVTVFVAGSFATKFPNPSGTMSACAPPFF